MKWRRRGEATGPQLMPTDLKLCALCGALNHRGNDECFTCGWHGDFSRDSQTLTLAWQRLDTQFESVRLEHVTGRRATLVGEFGVVQKPGHRQRVCAAFSLWWRALLRRRDARAAAREAALRPRSSSSGSELGV